MQTTTLLYIKAILLIAIIATLLFVFIQSAIVYFRVQRSKSSMTQTSIEPEQVPEHIKNIEVIDPVYVKTSDNPDDKL